MQLPIINKCVFIIVAIGMVFSAGCSSTQPPKMQVTGARVIDRSEEAAVISFNMELTNPNTQPLPLRDFTYSLSVDGQTVFQAKRVAELTLPQGEKSTLNLPAVVPFAELSSDFDLPHTYRISGQLSYTAPGALAEVLLDMHLPPPSTSFSGSAPLDSTIPE